MLKIFKCNKKLVVGLFAIAVMSAPFSAQAFAINSLQTQIEDLLQIIAHLQQQLAQQVSGVAVQTQQANQTQVVGTVQNICDNFTQSMWIGKTDIQANGEVSKLQRFLVNEGVYPEAIVSGYFGQLTSDALQMWQRNHGIHITNIGNGVFGPKTRSAVNGVCGNTQQNVCIRYAKCFINGVASIQYPCVTNKYKYSAVTMLKKDYVNGIAAGAPLTKMHNGKCTDGELQMESSYLKGISTSLGDSYLY